MKACGISWYFRRCLSKNGEMCLLYFGGYGLGRFVIEGIRTDTLFLPGTTIPVSQVLALVMVIASAAVDLAVRMKMRRQPD